VGKVKKIILVLAAFLLFACSDDTSNFEGSFQSTNSYSSAITESATVRIKQSGVYTFYDMATYSYLCEVVKPSSSEWESLEVEITDSVYVVYESFNDNEWLQSELDPVLRDSQNIYTANNKWSSWSE
jgi:hypothetical protein